jgi:Xaa-Pro aminopeptidase
MPRVPYDMESRKAYRVNLVSDAEYDRRISALRAGMETAGLDAVCVYGTREAPENVEYLTNFAPVVGSAFAIVHLDGRMTLTTDAVMHGEPMHSMIWMCRVPDVRVILRRPVYGGPVDGIAQLAADALGDVKRVGIIGSAGLPHPVHSALMARLPQLQPADTILAEIRRYKSDEEIVKLREAGRIADEAMTAVFGILREGVEETELAGAAVNRMHSLGGTEAFATSIVSGPRAGLKHSHPRRRRLEKGDMVFIDLGASFDGYKSDLSRCTMVGGATGVGRELLTTGLKLHDAGLAAIRPGVTVDEVAQVLAAVVRGTPYEPYFCPGQYGHCLGVSLFEAPGLFAGNPAELRPRMTMAYEPMVVMENVGTGVVEDTILITPAGVDMLTRYPTVTWD